MTNPISKADAQKMTNDYINFGNASHFDYAGQPIKGFLFTREELVTLFNSAPPEGLLLMYALSPKSADLADKHMNLVVGGIYAGFIDPDNLIVSQQIPHTGQTTFTDNEIKWGPGITPIPIDELRQMQTAFTSRTPVDHHILTSTTGTKIKGIRLTIGDLQDIDLHIPPTAVNKNDKYIFMPVVRSENLIDPYDQAYVSIATARFNETDSTVIGTIIEYCLPCPSACPNNYPIQ